MHSCIAALSQGIPCVGIAYSRKFKGVFDSVGVADWVVDARTTNQEAAIHKIVSLYRNRQKAREPLLRSSTQARKELRALFHKLIVDRGNAASGPNLT
jgi:polysaccharide pyruvyl transferase WcaK-like protein